MSFQLVRASDNEIVIWHTEHGHIFVFQIVPDARGLRPGPIRESDEAAADAASLEGAALAFAKGEARRRHLID